MRTKSIGEYLNDPDLDPNKGEGKEAGADKQKINKDYIITLGLDEKNDTSRFRERTRMEQLRLGWQSLKEKAKKLFSFKENGKQQELDKRGAELAKQAVEIAVISREADAHQPEQKETPSAAKTMSEYAYETPKDQMERLKQVAGIIRRAAPLEKGGNNALADAMESGNLDWEQMQKLVEAISLLNSRHKWDKQNTELLNSVEQIYSRKIQARGHDLDSTKQASGGMGEVFEAYAEKARKTEVFERLAELIKKHNPLKIGNEKLAEALKSEEPTAAVLENGKKAVEALRIILRGDKKTLAVLTGASELIGKELEARETQQVISIDSKQTKPGDIVDAKRRAA